MLRAGVVSAQFVFETGYCWLVRRARCSASEAAHIRIFSLHLFAAASGIPNAARRQCQTLPDILLKQAVRPVGGFGGDPPATY